LCEGLRPVAGVQVNGCKDVQCSNYGRAVDVEELYREGGYRLESYSYDKGWRMPLMMLDCGACGGRAPLQSNAGIARQMEHRREVGAQQGVPAEVLCCPQSDCRHHVEGIGWKEHPSAYWKQGGDRLLCKQCEHSFRPRPQRRGRRRSPWLWREYDAMRLVLEHRPLRKVVRHTGVSAGQLYPLLERGEGLLGTQQQALDTQAMDVLGSRERLALCIDRQMYRVNWADRSDRRKVMLYGIAMAEAETGYVLAMDVNFDAGVEQ